MTGFVLLLSSLTLFGAGVMWRRRRRAADSGPARPCVVRATDLPVDGEKCEGENGLAAFYAYQMAASKIDRVRGRR